MKTNRIFVGLFAVLMLTLSIIDIQTCYGCRRSTSRTPEKVDLTLQGA
jgi:hypothetical protein